MRGNNAPIKEMAIVRKQFIVPFSTRVQFVKSIYRVSCKTGAALFIPCDHIHQCWLSCRDPDHFTGTGQGFIPCRVPVNLSGTRQEIFIAIIKSEQ